MKKHIISVISWLLAAAMLVSMPVCAFAEEGNAQWEGDGIAAQSDEVPSSGTETRETGTEQTKSADTRNEETPVPDSTYKVGSTVTLNSAQSAYSSLGKDMESFQDFDKDYSFKLLESKKYNNTIWGKAEVDGKEAWFKMTDVTVENPSGGTGSTGSTGSTGTTSGVTKGVISHTGNVNVRKKPATYDGAVVGIARSIKPGTEVTIYEVKKNETTKKDWARIGTNEWVCMDYIKITSGSTTPGGTTPGGTGSGEKPAETGKPQFKGIVTSTTNLRVREAAGTNQKQVGSLPKGTEISVYATTEVNGVKWGRIGENKWVCLQYVKTIEQDPGTSEDGNGDDATLADTPIASGTVTSNVNLKVRTGAGTNFPIKTSLAKGSKISIFETKTVNGTQWGRMGKDQWVCLSYVKIDTGSIPTDGTGSTGSTDSSDATANATIVNCSTGVNVRATPSVTGAFVARISVNTRVFISQTTKAANGARWGKVDNGWVCMDYVKMDSDASVDDGTGAVSSTTGAPYANITVPAAVKNRVKVWVNAGKTGEKDDYLLELGSGAEINITGRALANDKQWGKVNINGITGWVDMTNITLKELSATVSAAQANAYDAPSTDANKKVIWGKGQEVTIVEQKTDGTYLWGKDGSTGNWVNMSSLAIKPASGNTDKTPAATISIIAKVKDTADLFGEADEYLMTLKKDTKIEVTDLKYEGGACKGRVTINNVAVKPITGWVDMSKVSQSVVSGKVSADTATLYRTLSGQKATLTLKMGSAVTILERTKHGDTVYGKLKINNAFYWIQMSNVSLNGASTNTGNTGNTGNAGNVVNTGSTGTETPAGTTSVPGVVKSSYVNVRSEASVKSRKVTQLKQGTKVTVYQQVIANGAAWGKIDQGWVAMEYIDLSSRPATTGTAVSNTTIMTSVPAGAVSVGFVNYDGLTIRSGAGTGYDKVGTLKKGTNVVITQQTLSNGMIWGKIDKGWICTSYVTMTGASITGSGTTGTIARCAYTVNVRSNPGVGNALVAKILVNSRVEILETKTYSGEQWGRTSLGWISMQYVLLDN